MLLEYAQHPFVRVVAALARRIAAEEAETAILMVCIRSGSFSNSPLRRECKCEPAHTRLGKSSVRSKCEAATDGGYCIQPRAHQQQDFNLCSVNDGAAAPRLICLWGRPP